MTSTSVPGIDPNSGLCVDPQAYFFWLIARAPGQPADDWETVLGNCGLPAGYPPHIYPEANGHYGITQQIGSDGRIAGRIFLPARMPDELGYYSIPVSPLRDADTPGHLLWEWRPLSGTPYQPWITESATGGSGTPDTGGGSADTSALESRIAALEQTAIKDGDRLALHATANNHYLRVEQSTGVVASDGANDGPWEEFTVKAHR